MIYEMKRSQKKALNVTGLNLQESIDRVHLLCKLKFQQVPCFLSHNFSLLFNTLKEVEVSTLWRKLKGFKDSYSCQLFHVSEQLGKYSIHGAAGYWKWTPSFTSRPPSVSIYVATLTYISLSILTCEGEPCQTKIFPGRGEKKHVINLRISSNEGMPLHGLLNEWHLSKPLSTKDYIHRKAKDVHPWTLTLHWKIPIFKEIHQLIHDSWWIFQPVMLAFGGVSTKVPRFEMSTMFHHEVNDFGQGSG